MLAFYLILSLGVSFLCSLFEAVILSLSPGYAASLVDEGKPGGKLIQRLKSNIEDSLAAILTLNTISHTIGAAGVGAEVLKLYGDKWVAVGSVILTVLILVLSEIIPKTLGATYWRGMAVPVAHGIRLFIWLTYPCVLSFKLLSKLIGKEGGATVTLAELTHTAELGKQEGTLTEKEVQVIKNIFHLRTIQVAKIMTPRTVVFALPGNLTVDEAAVENKVQFSRIPIYDDTIDQVIGVVTRFDLLECYAHGDANKALKELANPVDGVPNSLSVTDLLDKFLERQAHMFVVYDEHGGMSGVVTLEDAIETLLGLEIVDETDPVQDMRALAKQKWAHRREKLDGENGDEPDTILDS